MKRSVKQLKELESVLGKGKLSEIEKAISTLRDEEAFEGAIGLLIAFYDTSDEPGLRRVIEGFMNDMKDPDGREEVISEIRKPWNNETITMIASSCWQSGLDYSAYSGDFLKVFIEGDYSAALESLTVLEEFAHEIVSTVKSEMIELLRKSAVSPHPEKSALTKEMIAILLR
jgi:hypothetical protein